MPEIREQLQGPLFPEIADLEGKCEVTDASKPPTATNLLDAAKLSAKNPAGAPDTIDRLVRQVEKK